MKHYIQSILLLLLFSIATQAVEQDMAFAQKIFNLQGNCYSAEMSPDGKTIFYLLRGKNNYKESEKKYIKNIHDQSVKELTALEHVCIKQTMWHYDNHSLLYVSIVGNGNQLCVIDTISQEIKVLLSFADNEIIITCNSTCQPDNYIISTNRRTATSYDAYQFNMLDNSYRLILQNSQNAYQWCFDENAIPRAYAAQLSDDSIQVFTRLNDQTSWDLLYHDKHDATDVSLLFVKGTVLYAIDSHTTDRKQLVTYDCISKKRTILVDDARYDVDGIGCKCIKNPFEGSIQAFYYHTDTTIWHFFDSDLIATVKNIQKLDTGLLDIISISTDQTKYFVSFSSEYAPKHYWYYDSSTNKGMLLLSSQPRLDNCALSHATSFDFITSDNLLMQGYYTLPLLKAERYPLIVLVHGGPRSRDYKEFNPEVQTLSHWGYAVLQINFRGSEGYGKRFLQASYKQWSDAMHDDILQGVQWTLKNLPVDAHRIGIMGFSYGGYESIISAFKNPDLFRCAVSMAGPTDLADFIYQRSAGNKQALRSRFKRIGDPNADAARLRAQSPLFIIPERFAALLLIHGDLDNDVKKEQTDQLIGALKAKSVESKHSNYVDYLCLKGIDHNFYNKYTLNFKRLEHIYTFLRKYMA